LKAWASVLFRFSIASNRDRSQSSSYSCSCMIVSSRSLSRAVNPIIISLYFNSRCLYRSTCTLSSSSYCLSFSNSPNFTSYSCLITCYLASNALLNYGVSSSDFPPTRTWDDIILIFYSSFSFSFFSSAYDFYASSSYIIAAYLSSSRRFLCYSKDRNSCLFTTFLDRSASSARNFFSSSSYLRKSAFWSTSSLMRAVFLTFLARVANFSEERLSLKES
jgi:hypothetical protein